MGLLSSFTRSSRVVTLITITTITWSSGYCIELVRGINYSYICYWSFAAAANGKEFCSDYQCVALLANGHSHYAGERLLLSFFPPSLMSGLFFSGTTITANGSRWKRTLRFFTSVLVTFGDKSLGFPSCMFTVCFRRGCSKESKPMILYGNWRSYNEIRRWGWRRIAWFSYYFILC